MINQPTFEQTQAIAAISVAILAANLPKFFRKAFFRLIAAAKTEDRIFKISLRVDKVRAIWGEKPKEKQTEKPKVDYMHHTGEPIITPNNPQLDKIRLAARKIHAKSPNLKVWYDSKNNTINRIAPSNSINPSPNF